MNRVRRTRSKRTVAAVPQASGIAAYLYGRKPEAVTEFGTYKYGSYS